MGERTGHESSVERYGSAKHHDRPVAHRRPDGMTDDTVAEQGKPSQALEVVEHARGAPYEFHRLSGIADLTCSRRSTSCALPGTLISPTTSIRRSLAATSSTDCGPSRSSRLYDRQYWQVFRYVELCARQRAGDAPAHLLEAEMKHREQRPQHSSKERGP